MLNRMQYVIVENYFTSVVLWLACLVCFAILYLDLGEFVFPLAIMDFNKIILAILENVMRKYSLLRCLIN